MTTEKGLRAATDQTTSEVSITLLELTHPDLPAPEYFAINDEDIVSTVSDGSTPQTYKKSGFKYKQPASGETGNFIGTLRLDIVERSLVMTIQDLDTKPQMLIKQVLASTPDIVEQSYPPFDFFAISWGKGVMQGSLGVADDQDEPSSSFSYTPQHAPAVFSG